MCFVCHMSSVQWNHLFKIQSLTLIIACGCSNVFFFIPESLILLQSVVMIKSIKQLNKEDCSTFFMSYLELFYQDASLAGLWFFLFLLHLFVNILCLFLFSDDLDQTVTAWLDGVAVLR